jgi:zinc protease
MRIPSFLKASAASLATSFFILSAAGAQSLIPEGAQTRVLPNGMRAVVIPTDTKDVVALQIVMSVGSRNEIEKGKTGFAHFFEHLMFRGTDRYPSAVADAMLKNAGVDSNAWTWDDQTVFHKVFLKEDLPKILDYEADRFQHLKYAEPEFRTESLAVLGEYNKNSANPTEKMYELLQDKAFDVHTYEHTTMGFLPDIEKFPEGYEYSHLFFDRFYRPEYATLLLVGDVQPESAFKLVEQEFGEWKEGDYVPQIPKEPPQTEPREGHITWDSPTLPWIMVGYKSPPYSDLERTAALQVWESLAFEKTGELYKKLVLQEQVVDEFEPFFWKKKDPFLVGLSVRVTDPARVAQVRKEVLSAFETLADRPVSAEKLAEVKSRMRYSYLQGLNSPASIAESIAFSLSLDPDLSAIDRYYDAVAQVSAEDLASVAKEVFRPQGRTVITLEQKEEKKVK